MYVAVVLVVGVDPGLLFDNLYHYGFGLRIPNIPPMQQIITYFSLEQLRL